MTQSTTLLSICIPTYQRYVWLRALLMQLDEELKVSPPGQVEVCVIDNASTDETFPFLQSHAQDRPWLRIQRNPLNLGLEGNVIRAMVASVGAYTWLLSDHQKLRSGVIQEVLQLLGPRQVDIVCMAVVPWRPPLEVSREVHSMGSLTTRERSAFMFTLGNLSADLYRTELIRKKMRLSHQLSYFVYPHLAILAECDNATKVAQIPEASALPQITKGSPPMLKSYDPFVASFIHNLDCIRLILTDSEIAWSRRDFQTRDYIRSLGAWSMTVLAAPQERRFRISRVFLRAAWANRTPWPGVCSMVCLAGALAVWLPLALRRGLMRAVLRRFSPDANILRGALAN